MAETIINVATDPVGSAKNINTESAALVGVGVAVGQAKQLIYLPQIVVGRNRANNIVLPQKSQQLDNSNIDELSLRSALGTRVYSNILFKGGSYLDAETGEQVTYFPLRIDTVLIDVANQKDIVRTAIKGKEYTVKEYISSGDTAITITGKIVSTGINKYPRSDVQKLIKLSNVPQAIEVESWVLAQEGVFYIVIKYIDKPQTAGSFSEQAFTIQAYSDPPLNLF